MRTPALGLALGFFVLGCGGPPAEVTTDLSTTDAPTSGSPTSSPDDTTAGPGPGTMTSADTGEEVCPPMPPEDGGYDACPGLCGGGGQCFNDGAEFAVCTRGCFMDCNCWPAPEGDGDAPARCTADLLETTSVCVLDCLSGQSCPRGMFCVPDRGICAHPYPGSDTTESGSSSSDGGTTDTGTTDASTGTTDASTGTTDASSGTTDASSGTTDASTGGTTDASTGGTTDASTGSAGTT